MSYQYENKCVYSNIGMYQGVFCLWCCAVGLQYTCGVACKVAYLSWRGSQSTPGSSSLAACRTSSLSTEKLRLCSAWATDTRIHSISGGSTRNGLQGETETHAFSLELSGPSWSWMMLCIYWTLYWVRFKCFASQDQFLLIEFQYEISILVGFWKLCFLIFFCSYHHCIGNRLHNCSVCFALVLRVYRRERHAAWW